MAALSVAARTKIRNGLMRWWSKRNVACGFTKHELYNPSANTGAIQEADDWIDSAEGNPAPDTGYNAALTNIGMTAQHKGEMFLIVMAVRQDTTGEYARRIVQQGVD